MCLPMGTTSKCHFSLGLPSGGPKIGTFAIPELWMFISFSNQVYFENLRAIFYNPQKIYFQWYIAHPNRSSFDPYFQGVCGQKSNSQFDSYFLFYHNSCKLSLNEQWEATLSVYVLKPFQWCPRGPIWWLFTFSNQGFEHL